GNCCDEHTGLMPETRRKRWIPKAWAHLDSATAAQDVAQGPDREPSSARSAFNCAGSVESVYTCHCVRGRCEPRTARGPVEGAPRKLSGFMRELRCGDLVCGNDAAVNRGHSF